MDDQALSAEELTQVSAILEKEQPTAREQRYFRLFELSVYSWAVVYVAQEIERWIMLQVEGFASTVADFIAEYLDPEILDEMLLSAQWFLGAASIVLFVLCLKLVGKLWRQGQLGRKLRLSTQLESLYRQRRRHRVVSVLVLTILVAVSFYVLYRHFMVDGLDRWALLRLVAAPAMLCIYLVTMYFVRRGKEQFDTIRLLQRSLQKRSQNLKQTGKRSINIPEFEYDQIARLERRQIIQDRQKSIKRARQQADTDAYVVQKSLELLADMGRLDPDVRVRVEDRISELMSAAEPGALCAAGDDGYFRLDIPGTPHDLVYDIDSGARRIRIYSLETGNAATKAASREE